MRPRRLPYLGLLGLMLCCSRGEVGAERPAAVAQPADKPAAVAQPAGQPAAAGTGATATFAGGRLWCMQPAFDPVPGGVSTTVGYTGGHLANPTCEEVSSGGTGHRESIEVVYDPARVTYE